MDSTLVLRTLDDLVTDYVARFRSAHRLELIWFAIQPSLRAAIDCAGMACDPFGRRLPNQSPFADATLRAWTSELQRHRQGIRQATTFDLLHTRLTRAAEPVQQITTRTVYDTALRIGAFRHLMPCQVYLPAGTQAAARCLGAVGRKTLSIDELPGPLRQLPADEIEDCLRIYASQIPVILSRPRQVRPPIAPSLAPGQAGDVPRHP